MKFSQGANCNEALRYATGCNLGNISGQLRVGEGELMAEHIDLGTELAAYGGSTDDQSRSVEGAPNVLRQQSLGGPRRIRLADLQAQGFNTEPPPGYAAGGMVAPRTGRISFSMSDGYTVEPVPGAVIYGQGRLPPDWLADADIDAPSIKVRLWLNDDETPGS